MARQAETEMLRSNPDGTCLALRMEVCPAWPDMWRFAFKEKVSANYPCSTPGHSTASRLSDLLVTPALPAAPGPVLGYWAYSDKPPTQSPFSCTWQKHMHARTCTLRLPAAPAHPLNLPVYRPPVLTCTHLSSHCTSGCMLRPPTAPTTCPLCLPHTPWRGL